MYVMMPEEPEAVDSPVQYNVPGVNVGSFWQGKVEIVLKLVAIFVSLNS